MFAGNNALFMSAGKDLRMSQHETGVKCPICKTGDVVVEVESVPLASGRDMIIGPGSRDQYRTQTTTHCSNPDCQTVFWAVPGEPEAVRIILEELRAEERRSRRRF